MAAEWFRLARPFSLTAAAVPVVFGTALASVEGLFSWGPFVAMLLGSLFIQAATNMFNEFYDERRGLDVRGTVGIAGSIVAGRVLRQGRGRTEAFRVVIGGDQKKDEEVVIANLPNWSRRQRDVNYFQPY